MLNCIVVLMESIARKFYSTLALILGTIFPWVLTILSCCNDVEKLIARFLSHIFIFALQVLEGPVKGVSWRQRHGRRILREHIEDEGFTRPPLVITSTIKSCCVVKFFTATVSSLNTLESYLFYHVMRLNMWISRGKAGS